MLDWLLQKTLPTPSIKLEVHYVFHGVTLYVDKVTQAVPRSGEKVSLAGAENCPRDFVERVVDYVWWHPVGEIPTALVVLK